MAGPDPAATSRALFASRARHLSGSPIDACIGLLQRQSRPTIPFAIGSPAPEAIPQAALREIAARVLTDNDAGSLNYGPTEGERSLREALLERLRGELSFMDGDRLLVTTGGMQGLDLSCKLLVEQGDTVLVEEPGYPNTLAVVRGYGGEPVGVPMDEEGMRVEAIAEIVSRLGRRFQLYSRGQSGPQSGGSGWGKGSWQAPAPPNGRTDQVSERIRAQGVELVQVTKRFDEVLAVDAVSLTVEPGEFVTLLGPSGSGKSTTLMLLAGFERPTTGEVLIGGRRVNHVPAYRRNLGVVFQDYALFPHMTVFENLAFPLQGRRWEKRDIERSVGEALARVRLERMEGRYPSQLSGGQQQRVALARALVFRPPVLLMDEPLSALDKKLREQMQLEIKHIQRDLGVTVIYVTHDQAEALTMSDRIAVMNEGRIAQLDLPEALYERPTDRFVADFIGETNFIELTVRCTVDGARAEGADGFSVALPDGDRFSEGARVVIAIRPERIAVRPQGEDRGGAAEDWQWCTARVHEVVYVGDVRKYELRMGDHRLLAKQQTGTGVPRFSEGEEVWAGWHRADLQIVQRSGPADG